MKVKKNNFVRAAFFASAIFALCVFSSCSKKEADEDEGEIEALFAVNTYKTKAGNLDDYLEFGGDIDSVSSVSVLPDMAGKVTQILVHVGDVVSKNQTIAYVDASLPGLYYSASPVRAPIAGRITSFVPDIGAMVSQGTVIANIAQTDDLEIKVSVPERFISRISNGQSASVSFDAYPGMEFSATVFEVSPVLDTTSRTMNIKLHFDSADSRIKVGMYGRVRLVTESIENAIVVPSSAIILRNEKPYVFIISSRGDPSKVKLTAIMQGISVDDKTEITQGLTAGDEIVIKGQNLLNDDASVNIISTTED